MTAFKKPPEPKAPLRLQLHPPAVDLTEKIVSCAIMYKGGIFTHDKAENHYDLEDELKKQGAKEYFMMADRGFYTSKGRFLRPYDAMTLVKQNGQLPGKERMGQFQLFASDLWPRQWDHWPSKL